MPHLGIEFQFFQVFSDLSPISFNFFLKNLLNVYVKIIKTIVINKIIFQLTYIIPKNIRKITINSFIIEKI